MADKKHARPVMAILITVLGIAGTAVYICFLIWLTRNRWEWLLDPETPLNSLGDFLAGAFGPLAIWWLVLGYFQQGVELRQNSQALRDQADELEKSVEEQRKLAAAALLQLETHQEELAYQKQAAADHAKHTKRQAQPRITIQHHSIRVEGDLMVFGLRISNNGSMSCTDFVLHFEPVDLFSIKFDRLVPGEPQTAEVRLTDAHIRSGGFQANAVYHDGHGDRGRTEFNVNVPSNSRIIFTPIDDPSQI